VDEYFLVFDGERKGEIFFPDDGNDEESVEGDGEFKDGDRLEVETSEARLIAGDPKYGLTVVLLWADPLDIGLVN
jgi:hypothetical protein